MNKVAVIIVSHNSQLVLPHCLASLKAQTLQPAEIILVDSGSDDTGYLLNCKDSRISLLFEENIGFSRSNNSGYKVVDQSVDYVLFLNPDAFPEPDVIRQATAFLADNPDTACVSARLLGFDAAGQQPRGLLDSTGVFRKWYGRWYDRGLGEPDDGRYSRQEDVPAVCGAFLFCRREILDQVAPAPGLVFDPDFFLYKEDIELCLRIRKAGRQLVYLPTILVYHCRGWQRMAMV